MTQVLEATILLRNLLYTVAVYDTRYRVCVFYRTRNVHSIPRGLRLYWNATNSFTAGALPRTPQSSRELTALYSCCGEGTHRLDTYGALSWVPSLPCNTQPL